MFQNTRSQQGKPSLTALNSEHAIPSTLPQIPGASNTANMFALSVPYKYSQEGIFTVSVTQYAYVLNESEERSLVLEALEQELATIARILEVWHEELTEKRWAEYFNFIDITRTRDNLWTKDDTTSEFIRPNRKEFIADLWTTVQAQQKNLLKRSLVAWGAAPPGLFLFNKLSGVMTCQFNPPESLGIDMPTFEEVVLPNNTTEQHLVIKNYLNNMEQQILTKFNFTAHEIKDHPLLVPETLDLVMLCSNHIFYDWFQTNIARLFQDEGSTSTEDRVLAPQLVRDLLIAPEQRRATPDLLFLMFLLGINVSSPDTIESFKEISLAAPLEWLLEIIGEDKK